MVQRKPDSALVELRHEIVHLHEKMARERDPDPEDVRRFRVLMRDTPGLWLLMHRVSEDIRFSIVVKLTDGRSLARYLAEEDDFKAQLQYGSAGPLERILIDHILVARARLLYAEHTYNQKIIDRSYTTESGLYWDKHLSAAHRRFLKAVEALARVQKLAQRTPALQVNIASDGGRQINM